MISHFLLFYHSNDRSTAGHVVNKTLEEGAGAKIFIVLFSQFSRRNNGLQANELISTFFETRDDLTD